jgi:hypothetical protein
LHLKSIWACMMALIGYFCVPHFQICTSKCKLIWTEQL